MREKKIKPERIREEIHGTYRRMRVEINNNEKLRTNCFVANTKPLICTNTHLGIW